jgi:hypothetical protein
MITIDKLTVEALANETALAVNTFDEAIASKSYAEYVFSIDELMYFTRRLLELPEAQTWRKNQD